MPIVGLEKLYTASMTQDDAAALTYAAPVYYPGVKKLGIKPKQNTEKLYAENILWDQSIAFDSADVDIALADLTSAQRADLLGQTIASAGGVYAKANDTQPYKALLYKANLNGGGYRYGILYKGAFNLPEDNLQGQEGKTSYQTPSMSAVFQPTQHNQMWEYHVDTTDPNCPVDIDSTWFTAVTIPEADTTPPTVTTSPLDAATGVAVDANVVWTFSEVIDTNKVTAGNFLVMKATDGSVVAGALSIDATKKIVTFNPTSNLTAATAYIAVATTNITDIAGNALAAASITNFTTA